MYGLTGLAKLPASLDYLDDLVVENEVKTLVFAHHQNVLVRRERERRERRERREIELEREER